MFKRKALLFVMAFGLLVSSNPVTVLASVSDQDVLIDQPNGNFEPSDLSCIIKKETIVYESGPNLVKTTECNQIYYHGLGQADASYNDHGRSIYQVAIRYFIEGHADTGWHWSRESVGQLVSVTLSFTDTLDPSAPRTQFMYRFRDVSYGHYLYALPKDIEEELSGTHN